MALLARLADLALLTPAPGMAFTMHDVIRDYLSQYLGTARCMQLHANLLDAVADSLSHAAAAGEGEITAWWELPGQARYLRDHLIEHLLAADRCNDAENIASDLRWAAARLSQSGPAAPASDLALIGTPRAERLRRLLEQTSHLLGPTDPPHSLTDIFYSRVSHDPDWGPQARALAAARRLPALSSQLPLPDLPSPALRRTLTRHDDEVNAVVATPDSAWLATVSADGTARVWDTATWRRRATLTGLARHVNAVRIAPDGTWLATASWDEIAVWDAASGRCRFTLAGHSSQVNAISIARDGSWLATVSDDNTARIWDTATGRRRATLSGHTDWVKAAAIPAGGAWLATVSDDKTARIWDTATGKRRATLSGHAGAVTDVAIAPDGAWLATASNDKAARIWHAATGELCATLSGHTDSVNAAAIAPDGAWLATTSRDKSVILWDTATGERRATLTGHTGAATDVAIALDGIWLAVVSGDKTVRVWDTAKLSDPLTAAQPESARATGFAPDGAWLATTSSDKTVRASDSTTGKHWEGPEMWGNAATSGRLTTLYGRTFEIDTPKSTWQVTFLADKTVQIRDTVGKYGSLNLRGHTGEVNAVAFAPDGTWLAIASSDKTVRIWDTADGHSRAILAGHTGAVTDVAIAPDGIWLATVSDDKTVRIWDTGTCAIRAVMRTDSSLTKCVWSPDGRLLATAGRAGRYLFAFNS
jgi:WD40 repeat protein